MHFLNLNYLVASSAMLHLGAAAVIPTIPILSSLSIIPTLPIGNLLVKEPIESYIVVFQQNLDSKSIEAHEAKVTTKLGKALSRKYNLKKLKGYQIKANATYIKTLVANKEIAFIEKDKNVTISNSLQPRVVVTQTGAAWGLGRISHKIPNTGGYVYNNAESYKNTRVYVVDTGIDITHTEFRGRAVWGANFIFNSSNTDEHGHGTHCAGTIGGATFGVHKTANLVAVKVLNAAGGGTMSGVIAGIEWAVNDAKARQATQKSVISMSLGGPFFQTLNSAILAAVDANITVVVAAGNSNSDVAGFSPASASSAITVGAIDSNDRRASFSNFGAGVDIFAPGVGINSAWIANTTRMLSGTSMAAPHVAGFASYLLARQNFKSVSELVLRLTSLGMKSNRVTDPGAGSPNITLYNGMA